MSLFEIVFWPVWLFSLWLFWDDKVFRAYCWALSAMIEEDPNERTADQI